MGCETRVENASHYPGVPLHGCLAYDISTGDANILQPAQVLLIKLGGRP